jgi:hypothetical protein
MRKGGDMTKTERNETELCWCTGMRPKNILASIGKRPNFFVAFEWNRISYLPQSEWDRIIFLATGMRPIFFCLLEQDRIIFQYKYKYTNLHIHTCLTFARFIFQPQDGAARTFFIIYIILYNFRPRKESESYFDKYSRDGHLNRFSLNSESLWEIRRIWLVHRKLTI